MRYALAIEYCGTRYLGWQRQPNTISIQQTLEEAISSIAQTSIEIFTAGRTDKGVHASEQIVHFDYNSEAIRAPKAWVQGVNTLLPCDIRVLWAKEVPPHFHARHKANFRQYRYFILSSKIAPALFKDNITHIRYEVDVQKMHAAAQFLLGEHDFSSFRASSCQANHPVRTIHHCDVSIIRQNEVETLIMVDIKANAFLHNMVRNIVGMLLNIGKNNLTVEDSKRILEAKDRTAAPQKAPANGLYLVKIGYEEDFGFVNLPIGPRVLIL